MSKRFYSFITIFVIAGGLAGYLLFTWKEARELFPVLSLLTISIGLFGILMASVFKLSHASQLIEKSEELKSLSMFLIAGIFFYMISVLIYGFNCKQIYISEWFSYPGFYIRMGVYSFIWLFSFLLSEYLNRKRIKSESYQVILLVIVIVSFHFFVWDWLWIFTGGWESTLFAWYMLASMLSGGTAFYVFFAIGLMKSDSEKPQIQFRLDWGKFLFAFSLLWAYLWYEQYMIIWQTNLDHETHFIIDRFEQFPYLHIIIFVLGFLLPFALLLARRMKESKRVLLIASGSMILSKIAEAIWLINPEKGSVILLFMITLLVLCIPFLVNLLKSSGSNMLVVLIGILMISCSENPGTGKVYYPDMFYKKSFFSINDSIGFYYNHLPVEGTVPIEGASYQYTKDNESRVQAGIRLKNPLRLDSLILSLGKSNYNIYCSLCHGENADGNGFLYTSGKYATAPRSLLTNRVQLAPDGEVYHVITVGYNLMMAHGAQLTPEERWQIVHYVKSFPDSAERYNK